MVLNKHSFGPATDSTNSPTETSLPVERLIELPLTIIPAVHSTGCRIRGLILRPLGKMVAGSSGGKYQTKGIDVFLLLFKCRLRAES
jgi:hypothetical protein